MQETSLIFRIVLYENEVVCYTLSDIEGEVKYDKKKEEKEAYSAIF